MKQFVLVFGLALGLLLLAVPAQADTINDNLYVMGASADQGYLGINTLTPLKKFHLYHSLNESNRFRFENGEGYVDMLTDGGGGV